MQSLRRSQSLKRMMRKNDVRIHRRRHFRRIDTLAIWLVIDMYELVEGSLCFYIKRDGVHWLDVPSTCMTQSEYSIIKESLIELVRMLNYCESLAKG